MIHNGLGNNNRFYIGTSVAAVLRIGKIPQNSECK